MVKVISGKSVRLGGIILALCGTLFCQTRPNLVIHQSDDLSVVLRTLPAGYPSLQPYDHSYVIQPTNTFNILESLMYKTGSVFPFSRGPHRNVFSRNQVTRLAPALSQALSQAQPQDVVAFTVTDGGTSDRRTKGLGFVVGDELHLIIEELRKPLYEGEQQTYQQQVSQWELLLGDGQRYYTSRPGGKGAVTNWIITPLR